MKKTLGVILVMVLFSTLLFGFSSKSFAVAKPEQSQQFEQSPEKLKCFYDAIIFQGKSETFKEAVKRTKKEFKERLKDLCDSAGVEGKILSVSGPDQINFKEKLSFTVLLEGEPNAIEYVDGELDRFYRDPPDDFEEF